MKTHPAHSRGHSRSNPAPHAIVAFCLVSAILAVPAHAGSISGTIARTDGSPVANVFLDAYDESGAFYDYTSTAANGTYSLDAFAAGQYYLHTDTLGECADEWFDDVPGSADSLFFDPLGAGATPISVSTSGVTSPINLQLEPAAILSGTVTSSTGTAIPNIYVDAYLPSGTLYRSALTGENGTFTIDGLPAGDFAVRTDTLGTWKDEWHNGTDALDGLSPVESSVPPLALTAGSETGNIHFQLDPGSVIEGLIQDPVGTAIPGIYVDLYSTDGNRLEFTRTNADGTYRLGGLPAGDYYLGTDALSTYIDLWYEQQTMLHPADPASDNASLLTLGDNETLSDHNFTMDSGAVIPGRVTNLSGQPVANVIVDLFLQNSFFDFAITDNQGYYSLPALPDGLYHLKVDTLGEYLDVWWQDHIVWNASDPDADGADGYLVPNDSPITDINFILDTGGQISGLVTDPQGDPIPDTYIDLYNSDGQRLFFTMTNADGTYRLGGLPDSTYYLRCDSLGTWVDEWFDDQIILAFADPVQDGAAPLTIENKAALSQINLELQSGGSISGRVTDASGSPLAGTYVELFYGSSYYSFGETDTSGRYEIPLLPPGTYYLQTNSGEDLINEWYLDTYIFNQGDPVADGATPIALAQNQHRSNVNVELGLGADIEGSVRNEDGEPIEGAFVDIYDGQGRFFDFAITATDGSYAVTLLPPGAFYLSTDTFGVYTDQWFDNIPLFLVTDPIADGATPVHTEDGFVFVGIDFVLEFPPPPPVPATITISNGSQGLLLSWQAQEKTAYQVQLSLSLVPAPTWIDAPSGAGSDESSFKPAGETGPRLYILPEIPQGPAFFRVIVP